MPLTKAHIIEAISNQNGFTRKKSTETIETLLETIKPFTSASKITLLTGKDQSRINNSNRG